MYKNPKIFEIIFYVLAGLFLIYTLYSIYVTATYIASVTASGMYGAIPFSDILNSYVSQCAPYLFYACSFFFFGYVTHFLKRDEKVEDEVPQDITVEQSQPPVNFDFSPAQDVKGEEPEVQSEYEEYTIGQAEPLGIEPEEPADEKEIKEMEDTIAEELDDTQAEKEIDQVELENEEDKEESSI